MEQAGQGAAAGACGGCGHTGMGWDASNCSQGAARYSQIRVFVVVVFLLFQFNPLQTM